VCVCISLESMNIFCRLGLYIELFYAICTLNKMLNGSWQALHFNKRHFLVHPVGLIPVAPPSASMFQLKTWYFRENADKNIACSSDQFYTHLSFILKQRELVYVLNTLKRIHSLFFLCAVFQITLLRRPNGRFRFVKVVARLLLLSVQPLNLRSMNLDSISSFM